jgi:dTDP-4-dehydrorhamnose reductase
LRILLTGRNGQVGSQLEQALAALGEVIATDRGTLDIADPEAIQQLLRVSKPNLIVNAAAYTAVDKAESERELADKANAHAPGVLAEEAKRLGALLVHYSTDYVFGDAKRSPYTEEDAPDPLSHYARTKLKGERAIEASGCRHLIMRTSWVYGPRALNFYQIIMRKARAGEPMQMVDDQTSVPTTSAFVAEATVRLLREGAEGLLHLVPSGQATRYQFACEVVRAMGSRSKVEPVSSDRFKSAARRPAYSVLDNRRLQRVLGESIAPWQNALQELAGEFRA